MRSIVGLAITSGIPVDAWLAGDPRDVDTALELIAEGAKRR